MTIDLTALLADLEAAKANAMRAYEENRSSRSSGESIAFDAGRYEGLKQALELVRARGKV
jgi:hypothetical protein